MATANIHQVIKAHSYNNLSNDCVSVYVCLRIHANAYAYTYMCVYIKVINQICNGFIMHHQYFIWNGSSAFELIAIVELILIET